MHQNWVPLPQLPVTQALTSETFKPPPLDGSLTLPEIYEWHLENSPNHPLFVYADGHGEQKAVRWPEAVRAMRRVGRILRSLFSVDETPKVIAILSAADTITFYTVIVGIMHAGHVVFPISPRNSATAVAHLLEQTNVSHILVDSGGPLPALSSMALDLLHDQGSKPSVSSMPTFEDLHIGQDDDDDDNEHCNATSSIRQPRLDEAAAILHSSGSTAFPKPVVWTHRGLLQVAGIQYFGERDWTGVRVSSHSVPMFHGMGLWQTALTAGSGYVITSFKPQTPAVLPSPEAVVRGSAETQTDIIFCVPSFLEAWSRVPEHVSYLKGISGIMFGGGPLNKAAGDELYRQGVQLFNLYGCTECSILSSMLLVDKSDSDWEYFFIPSCVKAEYISYGNGCSEMVILPSTHLAPRVFNTVFDGMDAYATGDLLSPHPTKPGFWKVFGRADDQIIHSTGEKTNPGPLENILNQDPHVQSAVMFGRGKFYAGVVIDPKPAFKFNPLDTEQVVLFRQKIWASVERLNSYAPQHSRIFKEMILISKPAKPFTYTGKNTARRQAIIRDYEPEINELYLSVNESTQPGIAPPPDWSPIQSLVFVKTIISNVMKNPIRNEEDIFQHGCDSLQATWIRNTLLSALRKTSNVDIRGIPMNFVYIHPTIASLADYIHKLSQSGLTTVSTSQDGAVELKIQEMHTMVAKYGSDFETHNPSSYRFSDTHDTAPRHATGADARVVLLTGSTGGLGTALLAKLLESGDISRVYAVNRTSDRGNPFDRQKTALQKRALDISLLSSKKLVLIEGILSDESLGLDDTLYEEIRSSITHIIHNAYTVNFNMALSSFEPNIAGLRNLIRLALLSPHLSPPQFLFASSVGVLNSYEGETPVKEELVEAPSALGLGYGESKWVCEQILSAAAKATPLRSSIIRLGQLSGMSTNGYWNPQDWVPSLFQSSMFIGCLPRIENDVSWIAIDIAAQCIIDILNAASRSSTSSQSHLQVYHVTHPKPVPWSSIMEPAGRLLNLQVVPYRDWLTKLSQSGKRLDKVGTETQTSAADVNVELAKVNPALQVLGFFEAGLDGISSATEAKAATEAMGIKRLSLRNSLATSVTLRNCAVLGADDVKKWLEQIEVGA